MSHELTSSRLLWLCGLLINSYFLHRSSPVILPSPSTLVTKQGDADSNIEDRPILDSWNECCTVHGHKHITGHDADNGAKKRKCLRRTCPERIIGDNWTLPSRIYLHSLVQHGIGAIIRESTIIHYDT